MVLSLILVTLAQKIGPRPSGLSSFNPLQYLPAVDGCPSGCTTSSGTYVTIQEFVLYLMRLHPHYAPADLLLSSTTPTIFSLMSSSLERLLAFQDSTSIVVKSLESENMILEAVF